jgi:hypothetical protein
MAAKITDTMMNMAGLRLAVRAYVPYSRPLAASFAGLP